MAATKITNSGTEPFVLPSPLRGIIAPGQTVFLNLSFAQVATALGGSSTYLPPNGAILNIQLSYDPAYAGAYNSYYEGAAGGGNSVAIPEGRIPYGAVGDASLTSEAALAYNPTTNTLTAGALVGATVTGLTGNLLLSPNAGGGNVALVDAGGTSRVTANSTGIGLHGATPVARSAAIVDATNATDVITQLNTLLAYLRLRGDITA